MYPLTIHRYVAEISLPKIPGQECDPAGVGNDEFDAGLKLSKFGYPIVGLLKFRENLTKEELTRVFGISTIQGYRFVTQKLMDRLKDVERMF